MNEYFAGLIASVGLLGRFEFGPIFFYQSDPDKHDETLIKFGEQCIFIKSKKNWSVWENTVVA